MTNYLVMCTSLPINIAIIRTDIPLDAMMVTKYSSSKEGFALVIRCALHICARETPSL